MSKHPAPTRQAHRAFCEHESWEVVPDATGRPVGHHITYRLDLPDGRRLRTRISRPVDTSTYGPQMWSTILRDQLEVTADEFWRCVGGTLPARSTPVPRDKGIPAYLVAQLVRELGIDAVDAANLTEEAAKERLAQHWRDAASE